MRIPRAKRDYLPLFVVRQTRLALIHAARFLELLMLCITYMVITYAPQRTRAGNLLNRVKAAIAMAVITHTMAGPDGKSASVEMTNPSA